MTELDLIRRAFDELGPYVREKYAARGAVSVDSKTSPTDLLTEVDVTVQQRIGAMVADAFPGDVLVGEEEGCARFPDDPACRCWIVDPIDGTQNFVRGLFPLFGISIAFAVDAQIKVGGVYMPVTNDLFLAERGAGATRNGVRIHVSNIASLDHAWVEIDFGGAGNRRPCREATPRIVDEAGTVRCFCSAVVGLCGVAAGEMDGYIHTGLNPWDYAAGVLIVEEAGGRTSCFDGSPLELWNPKPGIVASNGAAHEALLGALVL